MSSLLEILAKGLDAGVGELLGKYLHAGAGEELAVLQERCLRHPDEAQAHCQLGLSLLSNVQADQAVQHLQEACRLQPDHLPSRLALAAALDELGQTDKAYEQLRMANRTHAGTPVVLFAAGFCLEKLERIDEAAELYADVVAMQPEFAPARHRLAAIALVKDDVGSAIAQYEVLRKQNPGDAATLAGLAQMYHRAGRYSEAILAFETVIAMEPDNWALVDDEVEALVASGQLRQASDRLEGLLEAQGSFADLHLRQAELLGQMGQDAQAMQHYHAALDIDPTYLEAYISLGTHHLSRGRWAEGAEAFCQASDINDRLMTAYVGLGVAQACSGKKPQALESFTLAAALEPNSTLLLKEMAKLQLKAALAEECERTLASQEQSPVAEAELDGDDLLHLQLTRHEQQVKANPGYADQHYRYGVLLRAEGRLGEAMEQFTQAIRINPTYIAAIIRLGITQQELGRSEEAIETFTSALELKPQYVDLHYRLAVLYTDRRRLGLAVEHMEKAAGLAPGNDKIRASLALSLQNMGLMDRVAATWRSLATLHQNAKRSEPARKQQGRGGNG